MAKITSKLQITIPKRIAEQYGIAPGDELEFVPAGNVIHLVTSRQRNLSRVNTEERLRLFDAATARQRERKKHDDSRRASRRAGLDTENLYTRGKSR